MTSPTVRRRRLSSELRRRRMQAGLTLSDVADELDWSPAKLGHIETGIRKWPSVVEVAALLQLYGVTGGQREAILTMVRQSRLRPWWTDYQDVVSSAYVGNEAGAVAIDTYGGMLIPDLLQVPEYTAAMARGLGRTGPAVDRTVAAVLKRQQLLDREGMARYEAILDEDALRRVAPEIQRLQLGRLIEEAGGHGPVSLRFIPTSAGPHRGSSGPFTLFEFESDESALAYVADPSGGHILETEDGVADCRALWNELCRLAHPPETTVRTLNRLSLLA
ncbi:helix-turn-helix transcriptional regulator [Lipingzhangella sp. LS1_29]|uniref:Helix-turn-helix transcriptional regulator n=1 Tax=Lipingzhangella rawalii TaxID=2055835 RepID=A0ABU2HBJ5_9ACTN|nr:helix-turn-helix transcriptional regulator [Lipingzhangella rawalii]MDS1272643.1 helix-turn-helix transcriptional regulator [Lipingzhangella rawalii]